VGGGHLDIDDGDIGLVRAHLAQNVIEVGRHPDDLDAGVLQQARYSGAQQ
jgi:hypothetical protein